jgi:hypothetical protein
MSFAFDLESLRKEHNCVHYIETNPSDPRGDNYTKHALRSNFERVYSITDKVDMLQYAMTEYHEEISKGRYHIIQDSSCHMNKHLDHPAFKGKSIIFLNLPNEVTNKWCCTEHINAKENQHPLLKELDAIQSLERNDHVILIPNCHILKNPYPWGNPSTSEAKFLDKIISRIRIINPSYQFSNLEDALPNNMLCAYIPLPFVIQPDYAHLTPENQKYLPSDYEGEVYRISTNWFRAIPLPTTPMKIMEIGAYHGGNVCSLTKTYASHPDSTIHCVDPWYDYKEYSEYKKIQHTNYKYFILNISKLSAEDLHKIHIHRGLSEHVIPTFEDDSFDIIYIDGNHDKRYALHDAIMSIKKIKHNGYIVFDDMQCEDVHQAVQFFIHLYRPHIAEIKDLEGQVSIQIKKEI